MSRRRAGAWAGLLAMLLLGVGPLLSQWLLAAPASPLPEPGCHQQPTSHAAADQAHQALWAKCGYCTLLLSSPAVTGPALLPVGTGLFAVSLPVPRVARRLPAPPVFPGARSRAPPLRHH